MRGISFLSQKRLQQILPDFNKVIELDKIWQSVLIARVVFDRDGRFKKAIADWKEAKKINRDNQLTLINFWESEQKNER